MKKYNTLKWVLVVSGACVAAAGCYVEASGPGGEVAVGAPGEVYVNAPPPAPLVDVETPFPGPGFIWIGGDWAWEGGRWQWHRGRWDRPPRRGAHWEGGHYEYRGGRHVYRRGGWR